MSRRKPYGPKATRLVLALLALLATAARVDAVQITVTTTADEINNDGDCSLREAFHAANTGVARDACPAGSTTNTDEIVLASDAVYSLTLPGSDSQGLLGSLVVQNNTATTDLEVTVAGGGTATISQDAIGDARVLVTAVGAHLDLEDVTIQGGTVSGTDTGGGVFINNSAQVALTRCVLRNNTAQRGGAVVNNHGTLIVEDSSFEFNTASASGGGISAGSDTVTLVKNTLFVENVALGQFAGGGAIESSSQISVVDSTFLNNRAKLLGGAMTFFEDVADRSSVTTSCFIGNEADFTHNAVDVFNGSLVMAAAGNWWGATDGPSGVASGHGDGVSNLVDFSPPSNVIHPACLPLELVANGGFQSDGDGDGIPQRWTPTLLTGADGRACADNGACIFKMRGNSALKRLAHTIPVEGQAGDSFVFKARSRAKDVPTSGGAYRAQVTIFHVDGSQQTSTLNFSTGKHGFERLTQAVVAAENYDEIQVRVEYGKASGIVRFDSVSLVKDE